MVRIPHRGFLLALAGSIGASGCTRPAKYAARSTETDTGQSRTSDTGQFPYVSHPALGPVSRCEQPMDRPVWVERGAELGLPSRPDDGRVTGEATYIVVDDMDGDGDLDIITNPFGHAGPDHPSEPLTLHRWTGDRFNTEPQPLIEAAWQPTLADLDGDGDNDLLTPGFDFWARNDPTGFTAVPWSLLSLEKMLYVRELEAHDLDRDGQLDFFALSSHPDDDSDLGHDVFVWGPYESPSLAEDETPRPDVPGYGFDAFWLDWYGDGEPEIFVANDNGAAKAPNALLQWETDQFVNVAPGLGLDLRHDAMGADADDFNHDGRPDLYVSATARNVLLLSQDDGTYVDATFSLRADPVQAGVSTTPMGWSGLFMDHDNDGTLDIFTTQGDWWDSPTERETSPATLLRFDGTAFEDVGRETGLFDEGSFRGAVARDFNHDGILDVLVSSVFGAPRLFLSQGCTEMAWLSVIAPNSARVRIVAGDRTWTSWSKASSGFGAHAMPVAHFGLGEIDAVDRLEWVQPGGEVLVIDGPFEPRRWVDLTPASR